MKDKITKLINVYKKNGLSGLIKKSTKYIKATYIDKYNLFTLLKKKKYTCIIKKILEENKYDRIILWRSNFGYNVPLYQRPQHIANNLSKMNSLVFYEVTTMTDNILTLKEAQNNLYLFNFNNKVLNKILMSLLRNIEKPKYIEIYSTNWSLTLNELITYEKNNFKIIYEYIDHLSPELSGTSSLPKNISDKYNYMLKNKNIFVVVTADKLMTDIINKRGKTNLVLSTNGVDYNFFKEFDNYKLEESYMNIINNGKINICYYGALAKWFDYELIKKIAKTNKYNVILIGIKYDESFDENISNEKNIYFLGPKDYKVLKYYARTCDILTIPFIINDITSSTSPLKIFEYMALNKPIVTTNMYECKKYSSVLIGENHEDFIKKLETAYKLKNDKQYLELLNKEALNNDWSMKAKKIIDMIKDSEK